ncbi:MAG: phosphoribosylpyrophosphate synthetase [Bacteroidia bacterium]
MQTFETLSQAINALKKEGYTLDFNLAENCLECNNGHHRLSAEDFVVDKFFRFDDNEDPSDQSILYAISSPTKHVKGLLVNGYGRFGDAVTNAVVDKLKMHL